MYSLSKRLTDDAEVTQLLARLEEHFGVKAEWERSTQELLNAEYREQFGRVPSDYGVGAAYTRGIDFKIIAGPEVREDTILHEYAHVLQHRRDPRMSVWDAYTLNGHGHTFYRTLKEVITFHKGNAREYPWRFEYPWIATWALDDGLWS